MSRIVVVARLDSATTPRAFAEAMVRYRPWWLRLLLGVRKRVFRRVTQRSSMADGTRRIAFFEVVQESSESIELSRVAGGYDSKLIVRVDGGKVVCESIALPRNLMGWAYLAMTRPIRWLAVSGAVGFAVGQVRDA